LLFIALLEEDPDYVAAGVIGVLFAALWFVFYPKLVQWQYQRNVRKLLTEGQAKSLPRRCPIVLHPQTIEAQSQLGASTLYWSAIEKLATTKDHFFLFLSTSNAIIIPKCAFRDDTGYRAFVAAAERYYAAAQRTSA
jgi:hypothetical protein